MMQDTGNLQQQQGVNTFPFENGIRIGTLIAELFLKPGNASFLISQFFFNEFTDVNHVKQALNDTKLTIKRLDGKVSWRYL